MRYCKAYKVGTVMQFPAWKATATPAPADLDPERICFLWEDFALSLDPLVERRLPLLESATDEWKAFCRETLGFKVPSDLPERDAVNHG